MPSRLRTWIASRESAFTVSATATRPRALPSAATYIGVLPSLGQTLPVAQQRVDRNAAIAHQLGVAEQNRTAVDPTADAVAGNGGKVLRIRQLDIARLRAFDDRLAERMLRAALQRGREAQARSASSLPFATTSVSAGSPRVMVPVLSRMMASSFSAVWQSIAGADQDAVLGALADAASSPSRAPLPTTPARSPAWPPGGASGACRNRDLRCRQQAGEQQHSRCTSIGPRPGRRQGPGHRWWTGARPT